MSQPEPAPSKDAPDRRMEILRQAAQVFRQKGYHGAGMREIAAGIGVAPGALYYYFKSKDDLLYACQDLSLSRLIEVGEQLLAGTGPADERLRVLMRAHLDLTLDELGGSAAHVEFHALPEDRLREVVKKRDRYEGLIRGLIQAGIDSGRFRPVDAKLAALALLGALNWTVVWWRPDGPWSAHDVVDGFADLYLLGLRNGRIEATPEGRTP
ncbi:MAG: TetR/AcrR family transcriptional regulator [Planctomycetota bacterium]|nr:TetR/AcrR family transcriptional regulator [Planctomycetota bacterium]